jgi:UDP-N-acetylglucosamine 2-epimerase
MAKKLKLMTILGTRPEIIRLSEVIKKCDKYFDHILVHTGQNWNYTLNQIFFEDLGLREPDYYLEAVGEEKIHRKEPALKQLHEIYNPLHA